MLSRTIINRVNRFITFFPIAVFCLCLFFVSCDSNIIGSISTGDDLGGGDGGITSEEGGASDSDSESSSTGNDTIPISMPMPSLKTDNMLVFKNDANEYYPIVAQADAVEDFDEGDMVMVGVDPIDDVLASFQVKPIVDARSVLAKAKDLIIPNAVADETATACLDDYDYCPIAADGSFACFVNPGISTDTFYFAVVDSDCAFKGEDSYEDVVQENLMYLGNAPTDIATVDGNVYALADSNGVSITENESGDLTVSGDYEAEYQNFATVSEGSKLSYGSNDDLIGIMGADGIQLLDYDEGVITDSEESDTDANATNYTFMRPINDIIYYGFEQEASQEAYLKYATTIAKENHLTHYKIYLNKTGDQDELSEDIYHTKTLAYSSANVGFFDYTVVAFVDNFSNIRFRFVIDDGVTSDKRLDGNTWKTTSEASVKDLIAYYDDNSDNIYFAILDEGANKLRVGSFTISSETRTINDSKAIDLDSVPAGMVYSETSGKLYVLNRTAQSVSVIPLMSDVSTVVEAPVVSDAINLSDTVTDKIINFVPTSLTIKDNELLVTDETTKSLMGIDISNYETDLE
jgi:hypothetical protein